jgi:hypothetical protein
MALPVGVRALGVGSRGDSQCQARPTRACRRRQTVSAALPLFAAPDAWRWAYGMKSIKGKKTKKRKTDEISGVCYP